MQRVRLVWRLGLVLLLIVLVGWLAWRSEWFEGSGARPAATAAPLMLLEGTSVERIDFDQRGIEDWKVVTGRWVVETMDDTPGGRRVLVQRAAENTFNVIVAPNGPYTDVDVSVRFKPMSGREDASGGIVFRFNDGRY
jgi:hypothetical protein